MFQVSSTTLVCLKWFCRLYQKQITIKPPFGEYVLFLPKLELPRSWKFQAVFFGVGFRVFPLVRIPPSILGTWFFGDDQMFQDVRVSSTSSEASPLTVVVEFYDVWFFQQQHPLQKIQVYGEIVVVVAVVVVVVVVGLYDVISTTFLLLTLFYLLPVISFKVHKAVKALVTHWFCFFPFIGAP